MIKARLFLKLLSITLLLLPLSLLVQMGDSTIPEKPVDNYSPMAVSDVYEEDDTFETAKTIVLNTVQDRSIYPIADPDFIIFELDSFYEITIKIENSTGDTRMWLYDFEQNQLAFDDDNSVGDLNSTIGFWMLRPGLYFIKVEESGNDAEIDLYSVSVSGNLIIDEYYGDDSFNDAIVLIANSSYIRSINPIGDEEYFTFTLPSVYNIYLEITGETGGDTIMDLYDDTFSIIEHDDDGGAGAYSKITVTDLLPGTYYVKIWEWGNNNLILNYTLHFTSYCDSITDTQKPTISGIYAGITESGITAIMISSTIQDSNGISEATLHYRVNSGSWQQVPNVNVALQYYYNVSLGPFNGGDIITYYLTAKDNSANHNLATNNNGGLYYSYRILHNDYDGPTIENIENIPSNPNDAQTVTINCTVIDVNDIFSVTLYYRNNSESWYNKSMNLDTGDNYIATFGPFDYDDYVEYYIVAVDNSTQQNSETDNNGGSNYSFTISSSDVVAPIIDNVQINPSNPTDAELVTISCTITDANTLSSADFYYRINSGTWNIQGLLLITGTTYETVIGPFSYYDFIEFYINATDSSPVHNIALNNNSGDYYNFAITSSDFTLPVISSIAQSIENPTDLQAVNITCIATDGNGISSVLLFYRVEGGIWNFVSMNFLQDHTYFVTIGPFTEGYFVEYYIQATDGSPNLNQVVDNNEGSFYSYTVQIETPTTSTIPTETTMLFFVPIVLAIASLFFIRKKK